MARRGRSGRVAGGVLLAGAGALSYGITVVIGRDLASDGVSPATALAWRFGLAGMVLVAVIALRRRRRPAAWGAGTPSRLVPPGGDFVLLLALGVIGYGVESTLFYMALERGTAAAVALLFYSYPAVVTVVEIGRGAEPFRAALAGAVVLSLCGTSVVVAAGADVDITTTGVVCALASAATFAAYLMAGRALGRRIDAMTTACWVALGASAFSVVRGAATGTLGGPAGRWGMFLLYGAATSAAFFLTFAALERIGTARTSVVLTLEAVSAVALGALFLDERIDTTQALGGAAVLAAAAVIALSERKEPAPLAPGS